MGRSVLEYLVRRPKGWRLGAARWGGANLLGPPPEHASACSKGDPGSLTTEQRVKSQWALDRETAASGVIGVSAHKYGYVS